LDEKKNDHKKNYGICKPKRKELFYPESFCIVLLPFYSCFLLSQFIITGGLGTILVLNQIKYCGRGKRIL
jgi:hypothetical protein